MTNEHIKLDVDNVEAKESPEFTRVDSRAVAGVSQEDLLERNIIGELEEDDVEEEDAEKKEDC